MYHVPPPTPAWNSKASAEQFIYEGEARPASAPQPSTSEDDAPAAAEEEDSIQVDAIAEETEEEEEETISIPPWQNQNTKRRARQVVPLLNQDVLDAMPTDNLI